MKHILFFIILLSEAWTELAINEEARALDEFREQLNDKDNQLGDWNVMVSTPCFSWSHVYCDYTNVVVGISLPYMNFSGTISPALVELRFLLNLNLEGNKLTGNIPPELGNISTLSFINLAQNKLTGTIPETFGQLKQLKHLILNNNNLSGEIPSSLANIQGLTKLILSSNNLSGNIPKPLFQIDKYNYTDNNLNCQNITPYHCDSGYPSTSGLSTNATIAVYVGSIGGGILIILLIICLVTYCQGAYNGYRRELYFDVSGEDDRKISYGQLKRFSWRELQLSTDSFSEKNILGQGGFGKVYIGVLSDDTKIAIKRLTNYDSAGGEATFLREVEMISFAVHRNLIRLIGFCVSPSERLLVYPYMKNLSLAYQLRDKPGEKGLDWPTRKNVAVGAAHGLEYLHEHCNPKIIHRDVKAANILLDEHFEGIVGDFGLAKLVDARQTHVTTLVCGTMGHIAPEYLSTGRSSEGTDVFGFGIMLLELVTGQRAIDFRRVEEEEDVLLLDLVRKFERQQRLDELIDKNLKKNYNVEEVEMVVQVALLCTQTQPEKRPNMTEVVRMLEGEGLGERWQEVRDIEFANSQDTIKPTQFSLFDDSTYNQQAIELSCAR